MYKYTIKPCQLMSSIRVCFRHERTALFRRFGDLKLKGFLSDRGAEA